MTRILNQEQFAELAAANSIEKECDLEYVYESVIDANDCEIAYATYHSYRGAEYHMRETPLPRAVYNEDGEQVVAGF